ASLALVVVLLTGVANAWVQVGTVQALWATPYGRTLLAKLLLVGLVLLLGAVNHYLYVPLLQQWAGCPVVEGQLLHALATRCRTAGRPALAADRGGRKARAARRAPLHSVAPPWPPSSLPVPCHAGAYGAGVHARRAPRSLNQSPIPPQRGLLRGSGGIVNFW